MEDLGQTIEHRRDIRGHRRTWGNKGVNIREEHGNMGEHRVDMSDMGRDMGRDKGHMGI